MFSNFLDFGFILSIAPGGGILEVSPFKLTTEMVQVMGGDINSPLYREFSEMCVKAYLACRYVFLLKFGVLMIKTLCRRNRRNGIVDGRLWVAMLQG